MPTDLDILFEKHLRGELTAAEQRELAGVLRSGAEAARFVAFAQEWVLLGDIARQLEASRSAAPLRLVPHPQRDEPGLSGSNTAEADDKVMATIYCAASPSSRRSWRTWGALAAALAVMAGGVLWWHGEPSVLQARLETRGEGITVQREGRTVAAADDWLVRSGDVIRTVSDSKATLRVENESTSLTLSGQTELAVSTSRSGKRIELKHGHLEAVVDKQSSRAPLVCVTPDVEIMVLGTRFFVSAGTNSTRVAVTEGRVRVTDRATRAVTELSAGQLAVTSQRSPPQVTPFDTVPRLTLPQGWLAQDVGTVAMPGSAAFAQIGGMVALKGSGSDIAFETDSFHFLSQPWNGDGDFIARLLSMEETDPDAKFGIMIREELSANSPHVILNFEPQHGRGGVDFRRRPEAGGKTYFFTTRNVPLPVWLRLTRRGDAFAGYISPDGRNWKQVGQTVKVALAQDAHVGLAVTSHDNTLLTTATLDSVTLLRRP